MFLGEFNIQLRLRIIVLNSLLSFTPSVFSKLVVWGWGWGGKKRNKMRKKLIYFEKAKKKEEIF